MVTLLRTIRREIASRVIAEIFVSQKRSETSIRLDSPRVRISQGFLRIFGHKTLRKDSTKVKIFRLAQIKKCNIILLPQTVNTRC